MSPKSRSRKPAKRGKPARSGHPAQRRIRDDPARSARSEVADTIGAQLSVLADTEAVPTAYEAEIAVSVLLGTVVEATVTNGATPRVGEVLLGEALPELVRRLQRRPPREASAALLVLSVVGPAEVASLAAEAARELPADVAPPWAGQLGQVTVGQCMVAEDEFGESRVVLCEFSYPGGAQPHCVFAVIDEAWHGAVTTLAIGDNPPEHQRRSLEKNARRRGGEVREVSGAEAGELLRDGIASFWEHGFPPETAADENLGLTCSSLHLAAARAAALAPGPSGAVPADQRWPADARRRLVEEFLASPQAADLRDRVARTIPNLLTTACAVNLGCDPTLIGPTMLRRLLLDVLPATTLGPDRFGRVIPVVVQAWTEWLAERNKLPARGRRRLMASLRSLLPLFPAAWHGPDANPMRRYIEDLSDFEASDGEITIPLAERRMFAVPLPDARVEGVAESSDGSQRDAEDLDAADAGDRELITVLELTARGVPRHRFESYLTVVRQLWDGEPTQVWEAARHMLDAGHSRDAALDRLARTWDACGTDHDGYPNALRCLF